MVHRYGVFVIDGSRLWEQSSLYTNTTNCFIDLTKGNTSKIAGPGHNSNLYTFTNRHIGSNTSSWNPTWITAC